MDCKLAKSSKAAENTVASGKTGENCAIIEFITKVFFFCDAYIELGGWHVTLELNHSTVKPSCFKHSCDLQACRSTCVSNHDRHWYIHLVVLKVNLNENDWNMYNFCSPNRDNPVQSLRRQIQRSPLRSHHLWRLQRVLPAVPELRGQLPLSQTEELCGRSRQSQPMSIMSFGKVSSAWNVERR